MEDNILVSIKLRAVRFAKTSVFVVSRQDNIRCTAVGHVLGPTWLPGIVEIVDGRKTRDETYVDLIFCCLA